MLSQKGNVDAHDLSLSSAMSEYSTLAGLSDPTTSTDSDADGSHVHKTAASEPPRKQTPYKSPAVHSLARQGGENETDLPSMLQVPRHQIEALKAAAALLLRTSQKLLPARQAAILLRNELDYERETSRYSRQYLTQSSQKLLEFAVAREPPDRPGNVQTPGHAATEQEIPAIWETWRAHELFIADNDAVDEQDEKIRRLQDDLSNKEFSMQSREKKLADVAREFIIILQDLELAGSEELDLDIKSQAVTKEPSVSIRALSPEVHPTLQHYYDQAGTARVLCERLVDLDFEHREALTLRLLRREQELDVEPSDEDFDEAYQQARSTLVQEYEECRRAVSEARNACVEQGIDPDDYRRHVSSSNDDDLEDLHLDVKTLAAEGAPVTPDQKTEAADDFYMGERVLSSAMLTGITGNLDYEVQHPSLQGAPDIDQVNKRVRDWIQSSDIEGASKAEGADNILIPNTTTQDSDNTALGDTLQDGDAAARFTLLVEETPSEGRSVMLAGEPRPSAEVTAEELLNDERDSSRTLGVCAEPSEEVRQDSPLSQPMPP